MESWKSHVRAELFQRDCTQKDPFSGVFGTLSKLAEQFNLRETFWDEVQRPSFKGDGGLTVDHKELQLQLRESEHITEKLSQTVSDLTTVLYLKDAELQYCHSQVSRYRKEAVTQARGANVLQVSLLNCESELERISKELTALQLEQQELRDELAAASREKEELLERWMEEKKDEAERVNRHNDTQERWHRFTRRLNKHLRREMMQPEQTSGHAGHVLQGLIPPGGPSTPK
ncbi:autophagy protein 16 [Esox lucius]|uniref:autophagy protein 16 n=1 Tax=Esox lucius TaxID=8010 RepID=UPI001476ED96|nr:autophagy protein 16 [Esox lucius]